MIDWDGCPNYQRQQLHASSKELCQDLMEFFQSKDKEPVEAVCALNYFFIEVMLQNRASLEEVGSVLHAIFLDYKDSFEKLSKEKPNV